MRTILITLLCAGALLAADTFRRAPGFSLIDSKMKMHDLADYHGKVVILEFMQTTCPHCNAFAPVLEQVEKKYGDRIAVLAILTPPDTPATAEQYTAAHKIDYPLLMDCGQVAYSYVLAPTVQFPRIFLIDGNGMIRHDYLYGTDTKDIFEGGGLTVAVGQMLGVSTTPQRK